MTALHLALWTFGFLAALAVRGLVEWWRLRRSFVRVRALDHIPTDVSFPRCLPGDPSPRPRGDAA